MQMTNKTQSQRIGTTLLSDLRSEQSTDSVIDDIHWLGFVRAEAPVCDGSGVSGNCGAQIGVRDVGCICRHQSSFWDASVSYC